MKHITWLSDSRLFSGIALALLAAGGLGGCGCVLPKVHEPTPYISGTVVYRERMALPPNAELMVALYEKTAEGRNLYSEERRPTEGAGIPLLFSIECPAEEAPGTAYELEASIASAGTTLFATPAPVTIRLDADDITLMTHRVMEQAPIPDGLAGIRWKLVELDGKPVEVYDNQPEPHLLFDEADGGRLSGSDGCNRLIGGYRLTGDQISFGQLGSTMMLCPKGDAQARALAKALANATRVSRSGERLELYGGKTRLAVFEARAL